MQLVLHFTLGKCVFATAHKCLSILNRSFWSYHAVCLAHFLLSFSSDVFSSIDVAIGRLSFFPLSCGKSSETDTDLRVSDFFSRRTLLSIFQNSFEFVRGRLQRWHVPLPIVSNFTFHLMSDFPSASLSEAPRAFLIVGTILLSFALVKNEVNSAGDANNHMFFRVKALFLLSIQ